MKSEKFYRSVHAVLYSLGGARQIDEERFITYCMEENSSEWRFQGWLGFGGKYRIKTNRVDCYPEDEDEFRAKQIKAINEELEELEKDQPV